MKYPINSLYLHFPFCKHLCNYCDFYKKVPQNSEIELQEFHQYLNKAALEHKKLLEENQSYWSPLKTLYIGGGTPSLWGVEGSIFLKSFLHNQGIFLDKNCEFTLEVNPASWSEESIAAWEAIGVNRFSLGVQTLNKNSLKYLDRIHSIDDVLETLEFFKTKKVNYSMDFMLGLPYSEQSARNVKDELSLALRYDPSHFSVYILTVKENYTYFAGLPSEEWIQKEYLETADFLKENNFNHYEVSNFSLINKESQHNLNYWKSQSVAALGASATGFLSEQKIRYKWKTKAAIIEKEFLSEESFKLEHIYMKLRTNLGIEKKFFPQTDEFNELISKWEKDELIVSGQEKIVATTSGYLLLDSLINDLFNLRLL